MVALCWMDLVGNVFPWTKTRRKRRPYCFQSNDPRRRQHQCPQTTTTTTRSEERLLAAQKTPTAPHTGFAYMAFPSCKQISPIIPIFVAFLLVSSSVSPVLSSASDRRIANQTLRAGEELRKLKRIRAHLKKINKPALKTIQSPDGDVIDCVPSHRQPAFDHPMLKGQKPLEPPERPKGHNPRRWVSEEYQLWSVSGESCPEGTIPVRRTKEEDMLRVTSVRKFGRKWGRHVRRDSSSNGHEHAVGYVNGEQYYGAKASINVWAPHVVSANEFSLSQIWVTSGSFGDDLNTIEAGWQVSPELYGDNSPRFFTYWTTDAYQATGCYNLLCSGFIQTSNKIAIGAAISPTSSYRGGQFDISIMVWKGLYHVGLLPCKAAIREHPSTYNSPCHGVLDPNHGNWWLEFGSGVLIGYWPSFLFSNLQNHATMIQYGGEVVNSNPSNSHTATQMGSGHFAGEGFAKASYFRNLQVVDWDNNLVPTQNLKVVADHPSCYNIQGGINKVWGNYFYYGGPGKNVNCP